MTMTMMIYCLYDPHGVTQSRQDGPHVVNGGDGLCMSPMKGGRVGRVF